MKKILLFLALSLGLLIPINLSAQGTDALPAPTQEEIEQPELPVGTPDSNSDQDSVAESNVSQEVQESFINGVLVGALVGLVIGGVFAWLFKDRIIKS